MLLIAMPLSKTTNFSSHFLQSNFFFNLEKYPANDYSWLIIGELKGKRKLAENYTTAQIDEDFSSKSTSAQNTYWVTFLVTELCLTASIASHLLPFWNKARQNFQGYWLGQQWQPAASNWPIVQVLEAQNNRREIFRNWD